MFKQNVENEREKKREGEGEGEERVIPRKGSPKIQSGPIVFGKSMPMKPDKQIVSPNWVILRMYC
jgi:hypothetical protein